MNENFKNCKGVIRIFTNGDSFRVIKMYEGEFSSVEFKETYAVLKWKKFNRITTLPLTNYIYEFELVETNEEKFE